MLNLSLATKIIREKEACVSKLPIDSLGVTDVVEGLKQSEVDLGIIRCD
jgi:hypothetical protein